ncbi:RDD family protein [Streptomyces xanthophaeus]|uniref:RDD family protein n=1 Tax=Streptomyces xanthophaeus TaxID=67385 RepID=UPI00233F5448|nr:RDD family protein [Streptomyces xanthophaeus]WCD89415.1 hypothetical protein KPP03845_105836 [Streptomyces xanthophaeus]
MFDSLASGGDLARFAPTASGPGSRAGIGRRGAALFLDLAIGVVAAVGPLVAVDRLVLGGDTADLTDMTTARALAALWVLAFFLLYSPVSVSRWGATPGKRLLGLEVVHAATGARLTYGRAALRHLTNLVTWLVPVLTAANAAAMRLDEHHRGAHDRAAGSKVVLRRG